MRIFVAFRYSESAWDGSILFKLNFILFHFHNNYQYKWVYFSIYKLITSLSCVYKYPGYLSLSDNRDFNPGWLNLNWIYYLFVSLRICLKARRFAERHRFRASRIRSPSFSSFDSIHSHFQHIQIPTLSVYRDPLSILNVSFSSTTLFSSYLCSPGQIYL